METNRGGGGRRVDSTEQEKKNNTKTPASARPRAGRVGSFLLGLGMGPPIPIGVLGFLIGFHTAHNKSQPKQPSSFLPRCIRPGARRPPPPADPKNPTIMPSGHGGGRNSNSSGSYRNPCLTMHQPWASLLVHGIKRVEGRSWPSPITGRVWIHAASKVPDPGTVKAMEDFYREIYALNGITDIKFPDHYPVSRLLGCVEVVGCVRSEELVCWEDVPESVRLEGLTDFCWLCENPQRLVIPFEMRGYQGVYNLERKIYDGAVRGLSPIQGPLPVKFPLPDPRDPFSLKPGSLTFGSSKSTVQKTPSVTAAIAGARAAATQFSRKDHNAAASSETGTREREQSWGNRADSSSACYSGTEGTEALKR